MLTTATATVTCILAERPGAQELEIEIAGALARAVSYTHLLRPLAGGERVVVNTTAVELNLGTGGVHFVLGLLEEEPAARPGAGPGHIVKLRYTPLQFSGLACEEPASPHHALLQEASSLGGCPVIACSLYSMIAPAAAGVRAARQSGGKGERDSSTGIPRVRSGSPLGMTNEGPVVAYVMTDSAALPAGFGRLAWECKERGLLAGIVTCGQAFGGDLEAVNLYSGLLAARHVLGAQVIVASQGPGNVGTGTDWGFSGIDQALIINAAAALGGEPVAIPRLGWGDPRPRHQGLSRHSAIALGRAALARATVVLPVMAEERAAQVARQLGEAGIESRHKVVTVDGRPGMDLLAALGIRVTTMGRGPEQEPEFFLAASAGGRWASGIPRGQA